VQVCVLLSRNCCANLCGRFALCGNCAGLVSVRDLCGSQTAVSALIHMWPHLRARHGVWALWGAPSIQVDGMRGFELLQVK
jgi:hypothetical protein